jgi:hypothetical protein
MAGKERGRRAVALAECLDLTAQDSVALVLPSSFSLGLSITFGLALGIAVRGLMSRMARLGAVARFWLHPQT